MSIVSSPCIRNCCLDEDDICLGCFRSMEEIMQWGSADEPSKRNILMRAEERKGTRQRRCEMRQQKDDGDNR
ncbi:MAG: DUF1289 domain-containing protein [Gammaproteobacteria bacterium]|nr:DUF1289 domain-containing protein [Gammaproteobacteria bacterium]